jgi:hypothetical protein
MKTTQESGEEESVREKNTLARLASWFLFLLAKHEFISHLASWRVVIRTPVYEMRLSLSQAARFLLHSCYLCIKLNHLTINT